MRSYLYKIDIVNLYVTIILSLVVYFKLLGFPPDYFNYLRYFNDIPLDYSEFSSRFEPAFDSLFFILKNSFNLSFDLSLTFVFFISLIIKLHYIGIDKSVIPYLAYFSLCIFLHDFTQIRLAIGLSFIYVALFSCNRSINKTIIIAIASLFHYSLLAFVVILMPEKLLGRILSSKKTLSIYIIVIVTVIITGIELFKHINPVIVSYLKDSELSVNLFSAQYLYFYIAFLIGFYEFESYSFKGKQIFFLLALGLVLRFTMLDLPVLSNRIGEVFLLSFVFLYPHIISRTFKYIYASATVSFFLYTLVRNFYLTSFFS